MKCRKLFFGMFWLKTQSKFVFHLCKTYCLLQFLFSFSCLKVVGSRFLRNDRKCLPVYTVIHPRGSYVCGQCCGSEISSVVSKWFKRCRNREVLKHPYLPVIAVNYPKPSLTWSVGRASTCTSDLETCCIAQRNAWNLAQHYDVISRHDPYH
jgi:hypothetical protein